MKRILYFLIIFLLGNAVSSLAAKDLQMISDEKGNYLFTDHLPKAQAFSLRYLSQKHGYGERKEELKVARWAEEGFLFEDDVSRAYVKVHKGIYDGVEEEGIFFPPVKNALRAIQFYDVPAASEMVIFYGVDDVGIEAGTAATVYLTVWVGDRKIRRILAPYVQGWKREVIKLGAVGYMRRPLTVTFEVTSDNESANQFSFRAEMLS